MKKVRKRGTASKVLVSVFVNLYASASASRLRKEFKSAGPFPQVWSVHRDLAGALTASALLKGDGFRRIKTLRTRIDREDLPWKKT